jgi:mannosyltransferase
VKSKLLTLAFFLVPLAVRLVHIVGPLLWYDEAFTLALARLPFDRMITATMGDVHPPLWYALEWIVVRLVPSAPWIIRLPAALFGAAACWLFWVVLGRLQVPVLVRRLAFLLMVFSPFQLYFSQEGRMYAMLEFLVLLAFWSLLTRRWIAFVLTAVAILYSHNYGLFYLACLFVAGLVMDKQNWRLLLWCCGLAGFAWLPWGIVLIWQMKYLAASGYWIQPVTLGSVLYALNTQFWGMTMPDAARLTSIFASLVLMLLGIGYALLKRPAGTWIILVMALGPLTLAVLGSWIYRPLLLFRSLIASAPFLYLLVCLPAGAIPWTRQRVLYAACFIVPLALSPLAYYFNVDAAKTDNGITPYILSLRSSYQPGDLICSTSDGAAVMVAAYFPETEACKIVSPQDPAGALSPITRQAIGIQEHTFGDLRYKRLWLFAGYIPLQAPLEAQSIRRWVSGMQLLKTFADDDFVWSGVYYAKR